MGAHIAHGLRVAHLSASTAPEADAGPGLVLLHPDGRIASMTPPARHWLRLLPGARLPGPAALPDIVHVVAARARALAGGGEAEPDLLPSVRVQARDGRWLVLHASQLGERDDGTAATAVIIELARPAQVAPLILQAHGLSSREREITALVLQGLSTQEIARAAHLSGYTVQDHLKAIFAKTGVSSRRELAALIFHAHYLPAIQAAAMQEEGLSQPGAGA